MSNFAITGVGGYVAPRHLQAIRDTGNRLVAALVLGEMICRAAFPGLANGGLYMRFTNPHREQSGFIPDDDLFWKLLPGNPTWEVNEDGFRGPPVWSIMAPWRGEGSKYSTRR